MQNPKIKLYHQHIVIQRVLNKYQILLRSHQIYNPSHIHSFLQETVGDHLNILRIRKGKGFLIVVLLYYMENILTFRHYTKHEILESQNNHNKYGCCFYKEKLHTNGFCLFCFLGFARRIFYPALFTLLYFIILVVAISF